MVKKNRLLSMFENNFYDSSNLGWQYRWKKTKPLENQYYIVLDLWSTMNGYWLQLTVWMDMTFLGIMCGSYLIWSVLFVVKYQNCCKSLDVYLLFAILLGQIISQLSYRLVTYKQCLITNWPVHGCFQLLFEKL